MLVAGSYVRWKSQIRRHIETRPNHELINDCIDNGPYVYKMIQVPEVPVNGTIPYQPASEKRESYFSLSDENKKKVDAKVETLHILLTGIDNDIYSTVDACANAK
ncbi:hypothetical protein Tco_0681843 [Tanacetum coccineum]|uniref:Uncharacterized protein n=1 Tax=Tanacetum coccineum TaxID=301880 RepID=A0ABQ4XPH1_9ASTR